MEVEIWLILQAFFRSSFAEAGESRLGIRAAR
jgi:hypothetical protein